MRRARYRQTVPGTIPGADHRDRPHRPCFREVGLLADGPLPWDRPVPARGPGLFVVELSTPLPTAPIELTRVGKWLEHVPTLHLDSARPTSRALAARLASFWLPTQTVLYIGATTVSIGGRVAAMEQTVLGDRRPYSGGHWLKMLRLPASTRVWWAATSAVEEYEDAMLAAFESGVTAAERLVLPDRDVILPCANLRRPTGERKATGISLVAAPGAARGAAASDDRRRGPGWRRGRGPRRAARAPPPADGASVHDAFEGIDDLTCRHGGEGGQRSLGRRVRFRVQRWRLGADPDHHGRGRGPAPGRARPS